MNQKKCMVQVSNTLWAGLFGTLLGFKSILPVLVVQEPGAKEQVIFWNTRVNTHKDHSPHYIYAYNIYSIYNVQFYTQLIRDNMKNLKKAALGLGPLCWQWFLLIHQRFQEMMDDDVCGFWKPNWYHIKSMSSSGRWKWPAVTCSDKRDQQRQHEKTFFNM